MLTDLGVGPRARARPRPPRSPRPTSTRPSPRAGARARPPTSSGSPPRRSTRSPASRRGTPPRPADTLAVAAARPACPTSPSWPRTRPPGCSRSSSAGCRPIRTTAGRPPPSPSTSGTPAARNRCGCPVDGVPDAELGRTGRGPRTELTHQVPGRRAAARAGRRRSRPDAGPVARRRSGDRPRGRPLRSGRPSRRRCWSPRSPWPLARRALGERVAPDAGAAAERPATALADRGRDSAAAGRARRPATRTSPATRRTRRLAAVVTELYGRRAEAFARRVAGAAGRCLGRRQPAADAPTRARPGRWPAAGEVLRGFAPDVAEVPVGGAGRRTAWSCELVDRWPAYEVVAAADRTGRPLRTGPGRPEPTGAHGAGAAPADGGGSRAPSGWAEQPRVSCGRAPCAGRQVGVGEPRIPTPAAGPGAPLPADDAGPAELAERERDRERRAPAAPPAGAAAAPSSRVNSALVTGSGRSG